MSRHGWFSLAVGVLLVIDGVGLYFGFSERSVVLTLCLMLAIRELADAGHTLRSGGDA